MKTLLPAEVHEDPAEVVRVLLHPVVERFNFLLVQEPQHSLLQCPRALARDDFDSSGLRPDRLVDDLPQRPVDLATSVVDVVQIELQLHGTDYRTNATYCTLMLGTCQV